MPGGAGGVAPRGVPRMKVSGAIGRPRPYPDHGAEPAIGSGLRRWDFCTTRMKWWISYKDIYNNVIISVSELREIHGRDTSVRRGNKRGPAAIHPRSLSEFDCPTGWITAGIGRSSSLITFLKHELICPAGASVSVGRRNCPGSGQSCDSMPGQTCGNAGVLR